jgi:hypothetical protein
MLPEMVTILKKESLPKNLVPFMWRLVPSSFFYHQHINLKKWRLKNFVGLFGGLLRWE